MGICDRQGRLCFAVALWNGRDPILKERLFGLTGSSTAKPLRTNVLIRIEVSNRGPETAPPYVKDACHDYVVHGRLDAVNPAEAGTKAALHYVA